MKHLLITGGCGFIGANFIRFLLEESDFAGRVINVDKLTYAGNPENLAQVAKRFKDRYTFIKADIADQKAMNRIFELFPIDSICHLAAESHVDRSIAAPDQFIRTNVMGTFRLLESARKHQDRMVWFHHVSTDEVFGSLGPKGKFIETTPYQPSSPYSASKASSDHLVRSYHKTYGLPVTISNCSNNYGPYQFPEKLIPLVISNAFHGKPLPVYGDGKNIRDWLFVKDHCRAILTIMKKGRNGETYNVGGQAERSNIHVVEKICDILDQYKGPLPNKPRKNLITFVKDRPGHDFRYAIDSTKLQNELKWKPVESFESGLEKTVQWYLDNQQWVSRVKSGQYRDWIQSHYGSEIC